MGITSGNVISALSGLGGGVALWAGLWLNGRADKRGLRVLSNAQQQTAIAARGVWAQETDTLVQGALDMAAGMRAENAQLRADLAATRQRLDSAEADLAHLRAIHTAHRATRAAEPDEEGGALERAAAGTAAPRQPASKAARKRARSGQKPGQRQRQQNQSSSTAPRRRRASR